MSQSPSTIFTCVRGKEIKVKGYIISILSHYEYTHYVKKHYPLTCSLRCTDEACGPLIWVGIQCMADGLSGISGKISNLLFNSCKELYPLNFGQSKFPSISTNLLLLM